MNNTIQDFKDVVSVLRKHNTKFFLIYGTALGAYRDKAFIPNDYDIDIGSFDNSKREEIVKDLEALGFDIGVLYDTETRKEIPAKMILSERNTRVDIFFFEEKDGEYVAWKHPHSHYPFKAMPLKFKEMQEVEIYGEKVDIPSPIEEYLEYLYTDWRVPSKEQGRLYADVHGLPKEKYV